jgi:hypothetical protein
LELSGAGGAVAEEHAPSSSRPRRHTGGGGGGVRSSSAATACHRSVRQITLIHHTRTLTGSLGCRVCIEQISLSLAANTWSPPRAGSRHTHRPRSARGSSSLSAARPDLQQQQGHQHQQQPKQPQQQAWCVRRGASAFVQRGGGGRLGGALSLPRARSCEPPCSTPERHERMSSAHPSATSIRRAIITRVLAVHRPPSETPRAGRARAATTTAHPRAPPPHLPLNSKHHRPGKPSPASRPSSSASPPADSSARASRTSTGANLGQEPSTLSQRRCWRATRACWTSGGARQSWPRPRRLRRRSEPPWRRAFEVDPESRPRAAGFWGVDQPLRLRVAGAARRAPDAAAAQKRTNEQRAPAQVRSHARAQTPRRLRGRARARFLALALIDPLIPFLV